MGIQSHAIVNPESLTVPCYKVSSFHVSNEPVGFFQRLKFLFRPWVLEIKYEVLIAPPTEATFSGEINEEIKK